MSTVRDEASDGTGERLRTLGLALLVALGGPALGILVLYAVAIGLLIAGVDVTPGMNLVLSLVFVTGVGFGGASLLYLRIRDLGWGFVPVEVPSLRDLLWAGSGYVLGLLGVFAVATAVTAIVGRPEATNQAARIAMNNPWLYAILIPASFLVIGPGEELLYRGIVQGTLWESFSAAPAVAIASAVFALVHFAALTGGALDRIVVLFILFVPALVLGVAYELTDNLVVPILIHGSYDATIFALQYLVVRYASGVVDAASAVALLPW